MNTKTATNEKSIDTRTIRAATESMAIDRHAGGAGEYDVYAESGEVYRVNTPVGACECPSDEYQEGPCKHRRRVELETGEREIPDLEGETDVEMMIRAREEYRGIGDSTVDHRPADDAVVVTDGGETSPAITRHVEPESQALTTGEPAAYFRCEGCGTEAMRRRDLEGEAHKRDCEAQRCEPARSEPADFGGGETTGVQML